ncbi:MAG: hypothetical protein HC866_17395 [Leptolyngbyaceae cyanobacterium RU_5_1]|nr:hypothetical protein [Leptolyngbyaceae cyanobacterium RU_5_1]
MNSTIDFTPANFNASDLARQDRPFLIVLQPNGDLNHTSSYNFQKMLETALEKVLDSVVVDLLWVNATDSKGISALVAGIERAANLGKSISFQSMDRCTRAAMDAELDRQREIRFGPWNDIFEADLERFLGNPFVN